MYKITKYLLIIISLFIIVGCNSRKDDNSKEVVDMVKVIIDEKEYTLNLEGNETAKSFALMLPKEFSMRELNGNEKYVYLNETLPTNQYSPKRINKGDVMLFGDNCLVIFYKSFDTPYSYTKIGYIDELPDLDEEDITITFK